MPADPHSLDRANLQRFSEADYRTIALHRLGGLADAGAVRPIVTEPVSTGDDVHDFVVHALWRSRVPISDGDYHKNDPPLRVEAFPPAIAEQMMGHLERWVDGADDDTYFAEPTMRDLASEAGISDDTFRRVRRAAQIQVMLKGAAARNRRYHPREVDALIGTALAGNFIERTAMADKWKEWSSNNAAGKPHARK